MIKLNPDAQKLNLRSPHILIATWFGSGLLLPAPGTWGSLAALPFGLLILWLGGAKALLVAIILVFIIGLWATKKFQTETKTHDSKMIVIDEVAGQWIPLLFCGLMPLLILLALFLFRIFDILKPTPIGWLDKNLSDEWGVMLDDILAGIFAAIALITIESIL